MKHNMEAAEAMEIWRQISDFDFMDLEVTDGSFKFFGTAADGSPKMETIHTETLKHLARNILPCIEQ